MIVLVLFVISMQQTCTYLSIIISHARGQNCGYPDLFFKTGIACNNYNQPIFKYLISDSRNSLFKNLIVI